MSDESAGFGPWGYAAPFDARHPAARERVERRAELALGDHLAKLAAAGKVFQVQTCTTWVVPWQQIKEERRGFGAPFDEFCMEVDIIEVHVVTAPIHIMRTPAEMPSFELMRTACGELKYRIKAKLRGLFRSNRRAG